MDSHYCLVEFPDEADEDNNIPFNIISSTWLFHENEQLFCYWPTFKTDSTRLKKVTAHAAIDTETSVKCRVNLKYENENSQKVLPKSKHFEEHDTCHSGANEKRKKVPPKFTKEYVFSSDSSNSSIPEAPQPHQIKQSTSKSQQFSRGRRDTSVMTHRSFISSSSSRSSFSGTTTLKGTLQQTEPDPTDTTPANVKNTCVCDCQKNTALLTEVILELSKQAKDLKYVIQLLQIKDNLTEKCLNISNNQFKQIATTEGLDQFNTDLDDLQHFKMNCTLLQQIGGKNVHENTRRLLSTIISNEVSLGCNWSQ